MMKLFHPDVFQGNLRKSGYFEGWYFKHVSPGLEHVLAFIPGVSLSKEDPHAFTQVIDGVSGQTWYMRYELSDFSWNGNPFTVTVGRNRFSREGCTVRVSENGLELEASLRYTDGKPFPGSLVSPGVMGPFAYIPFMECNHGVVSMHHNLEGSVSLNGSQIDFSEGSGYAEKDWGKSFPEAWIWLQCNNFAGSADTSFMLSIAKIPWLGRFFMGFLSFFYHKGKLYRFATYNGSKLQGVTFSGRKLELSLAGKSGRIDVSAFVRQTGELKAPDRGSMTRRIKESVDSEVELVFSDRTGEEIFRGRGKRAGLEIIPPIIDLLT